MSNKNVRKYLQVLGVISCLAVVFLHTNGVFWTFSYERYWITANIIESVCYFAVPVFLMTSGCNLMDYRKSYDTKTYFKKRIAKTVIPFIIWSLIGCVYNIVMHVWGMESLSPAAVFNAIFGTSAVGIYWFFMPLFSIYLIIPALSLIPEENRQKMFGYLLSMGFIFNMLLPFIFGFIGLNYNGSLYVPLMSGYMIYPIAGYYIDRYPIKKKHRMISYIAGVLGLMLHIVGTMLWSFRDGMINETFKGYLNVPCVLYTIAIFIFFKYMDQTKWMDLLHKVTYIFADTTFGVYLIHFFVMDLFLRFSGIHPTSIVYRIVGGFGIFLVSVICTKMIKKIPILQRIIP